MTKQHGGARAGAGRPPASLTLRVGDGIALRYGERTPLELGAVTELHRGRPRTAVIALRNGETVWLLVETPQEAD